jgi:hypothetical protein
MKPLRVAKSTGTTEAILVVQEINTIAITIEKIYFPFIWIPLLEKSSTVSRE